jgi:hypothetical protein
MISPSGSSTSLSLDSDLLEKTLYSAVIGCQAWNITKCEELGNLCVLEMYDKSSAACQAYQTIAKARPVVSNILYDR